MLLGLSNYCQSWVELSNYCRTFGVVSNHCQTFGGNVELYCRADAEGLSNYCQTGVIQALLVQFRVCSGKSKLWSPTEFWRVFHSPKTYIASRFFDGTRTLRKKQGLFGLSFVVYHSHCRSDCGFGGADYFHAGTVHCGFLSLMPMTLVSLWHNSLHDPSPKTRGHPRTTMDTTA